MRAKKRLQWSREEDNGVVLYKAKRKTETAFITPNQEGGYTVIYRSKKCKKKIIVRSLVDGKQAAEEMRQTSYKRNPLVPSKNFLVGLSVGVGATAIAAYFYTKQNQAAVLPAQTPKTVDGTYVTITPGTTSTSWSGGTMFVDLPTNGKNWVSINGTSATGNQPLQLADNPVGTYQIVYTDSTGTNQTTTLTVTATSLAPVQQ